MKYNFCITLEMSVPPFVRNIEFHGSRLQADRVFYALSFALPLSDCERIILFCGHEKVCETMFHNKK